MSDIESKKSDIYNLIKNKNDNKKLKLLCSNGRYSNDFILKLLLLYKNNLKSNLTNEQLKDQYMNIKKIITEDKKHSLIEENMYKEAYKYYNFDSIKILFEYDGCNDDNLIKRVKKYNILYIAVRLNNYNFIKNILNYSTFNHRYINSGFEYYSSIRYYPCNYINYETIFSQAMYTNDIKIIKLLTSAFICNSCFPNDNCKYPYIIKNKKDNILIKNYKIRYLNLILNLFIKNKKITLLKNLIEDNEFSDYIDLNIKDINGNYLIITALDTNNFDIFKYLIDHGVDCNSKNNNGVPILLIAIQNENEDMIETLLNQPNINIREKDPNDYNSITKAININNNCIVDLLIKHAEKHHIKISLNEKDKNGDSTLIHAINKNNFDNVVSLMDYGQRHNINVNMVDKNGCPPLILSYKLNHMLIFNYLLNYFDINQIDAFGNNLLFYVIDKNDVALTEKLISCGMDINNENNQGISILDYAILNNCKEITDLLLNQDNLILNKRNSQGRTPLIMFIRKFSDEETIGKFIKRGANVNLVDSNGMSPLIHAIEQNKYSIVRLLIKNGALNIKDKKGMSPMDYGLLNVEGSSIRNCLYDNGFINYDVKNIKDKLLNYIIYIEEIKILKFLLDDQLKINKIFEESGETLLHKAIKFNKLNIVELLLKYDADKSIKNKDGDNALKYYMKKNNKNYNYKICNLLK